jgi:enoyl-CoA hydratase
MVANGPLKALAAQLMDASLGYEILSNMTADRAEAVAAMREKRPARLSGE